MVRPMMRKCFVRLFTTCCLVAPMSICFGADAQTTTATRSGNTAGDSDGIAQQTDTKPTGKTDRDDLKVSSEGTISDDIVVTGRRAAFDAIGNQKLVDTPFSVSSIDRSQIRKNGITTLNDLSKLLSSAKIATPSTASGSLITIRGDTSGVQLIDGLPVLGTQIEVPLEPYEEVQVLAGLSSFYFGVSSGGGIVNYITKRPSVDFKSSVTLGFETDSVLNAAFDVGDTVGPLGYRANLAVSNGTQSAGRTGLERYVGSLALDLALGADTVLSLDGLYSNRQQDHVGGYVNYTPADGEDFLKPISGHQRLAGESSRYRSLVMGGTATLRHVFSEKLNMKLSVSYYRPRYTFGSVSTNVDNYAGDISGSSYFLADYYTENKAVQGIVNGSFDTGPLSHAISAGFLITEADTYYGATDDGTQFPFDVIENPTNLYEGFTIPEIPAGIEKPSLRNKTRAVRDNQVSGFVSDNISLGEHVKALVGVRYFSFRNRSYGANFVTGGDLVDKLSRAVPIAALLYKPGTNSTFYISYSKGFENGRIELNPVADGGYDLIRIPAIISDQYEIGYKLEGSRLKANVALYEVTTKGGFIDFEDTGLPQGPVLSIIEGGATRRRGVELSSSLLLGDRLTLFAGANYARLKNLNVPADIAPTNIPGELLYKVRLSARLDASGNLEGFVGIDGNSRSRAVYDQNISFPAYTVMDVGLSHKFDISGREVRAQFTIDNLLGEKYWLSDFDANFSGNPRTIRTQLSVAF